MDEIKESLKSALRSAKTVAELNEVRGRFLGRSGTITSLAKNTDFSGLSSDQKRDFGKNFNDLRVFAETEIAQALAECKAQSQPTEAAGIDLMLPGTGRRLGSLHPIALVQMELEVIFRGLGFRVLTGLEVETEQANFDGLNIPADHPAREMQDTFWLKNGRLLRTHTSANQVRSLKKFGAPLSAIFPGRCFRYEEVDASHENTFYQLEGLHVDRDVSVANLIAVMRYLLSEIFHRDVVIRLRPGFFPFVEPGFELDIQCLICGGKGCSVCKYSSWVELIPCGLVHPQVLANGGIDPDQFSGFAFGLGLTRLAMMKFGIPDIRLFNCGDVRFYEQFPPSI